MKTIAVIICYIGKLPEWLPLWIQSCSINDTIDFFLMTDQKINYSTPLNLYIIKTNLKELRERFSKTLGFPCELSSAYKLCDYKVIYGASFQDILAGYDFWGHCDMDMVFGNLRKFISEEILSQNDRVFEIGHLSLYRNNEKINNAYKLEGAMFDYKFVYKESHCCGFDEHTGVTRIFAKKGIQTYNKVVCADIDPHYRAFYMMDEGTVNGKMENCNYKHQVFGIIDNAAWQIAITDGNETKIKEVSYIHFMRKNPQNAQSCIGKNYLITYKSFVPINKEDISTSLIQQYAYTSKGLRKKIEYVKAFIKNGWLAWKRGELILRIRLRIGRVKWINALIIRH